jgi:hypothetical protein
VSDHNRKLLEPLNKLLEANDRLATAISATKAHWPHVTHCWIDQLEPTKLLEDHRLKPLNEHSR